MANTLVAKGTINPIYKSTQFRREEARKDAQFQADAYVRNVEITYEIQPGQFETFKASPKDDPPPSTGKDYDSNESHPKIDFQGEYPNLQVSQDAAGGQIIKSIEPGKESTFVVQPSGSYEGHGPNGEVVSVTVGKEHKYNADGVSSVADGHSDTKVSGSSRTTVAGGSHSETAGNKYDGAGGVSISGSGDSQINHSSGDGFQITEGNIVTDHTGSVNHNFNGDYVEVTNGHKITIVNGENGINVQDGNMDTQVSSGKYRVKASSDILIDSDTQITLKVGGSMIIISPSNITLSTSGDIVVKGNNGVQLAATDGETTVAGKTVVVKSKQGTKIEAGGTIPPLPWVPQ